MFIRHCLAFPFFLSCLSKKISAKVQYNFPNNPDRVRTQIYESPITVKEMGCFPTFNTLTDYKGGRWFESFWGVIHSARMRQRGNTLTLTPDWRSYVGPGSVVEIVFAEDHKSNTVTFSFNNQLQPICLLWELFLSVGIGLWLFTKLAPWLRSKQGSMTYKLFVPHLPYPKTEE